MIDPNCRLCGKEMSDPYVAALCLECQKSVLKAKDKLVGAWVDWYQVPYQLGTPDIDRLQTSKQLTGELLYKLDERAAKAFLAGN